MLDNWYKQRSSREVNQKNKLEIIILLKGGQAVQKSPNPINEATKKQKIDEEKKKRNPQTDSQAAIHKVWWNKLSSYWLYCILDFFNHWKVEGSNN